MRHLPKIKICGITNLEDALSISKLKPHALGFVFFKKSPRCISLKKAKEIIKKIPVSIKKIGVFVDEKEHNIKFLARYLDLDMLQFHGEETPQFCRRFKNYRVIKCIRIKNKKSLENIGYYQVWAIMFDSYKKGFWGGTGKKFDWNLVKNLQTGKKLVFLSGGLHAGNVKKAIKLMKPDWVDVSSSLESRPGKKNIKKVKKFIETVRKK